MEKLLLNTQGTGNPCAPEAAIAIRDLAQVLLVVVFRVVESLALPDVGGDRPKAMC